MRALIFSLCLLMAAPPAWASSYRRMFEELDRRNRQAYAPSLAAVKLAQSLLVSNQYLAAMAGRFGEITGALNAKSEGLSAMVSEMGKLTAEPSMESYKKFLQTALAHRLLTSHALADIVYARRVAGVFGEQRNFFEDYCPPRVKLLGEPDKIPSLPQGMTSEGTAYTRHHHLFSGKESGVGTFSDDPVADGAAIATLQAAIVVGIALYAYTSGLTLAAALSVFSASGAGAAGGAVLTGTGVGAVILIAAVAVAVIVSVAVTENENRKRKKEAEEKYEQELEDFRDARAWYDTQRITAREFQEIALGHCEGIEWKQRINNSRDALHGNIARLNAPLAELDEAEARLQENEKEVNTLVDNFATGLIAIYSAEYVESVRLTIIPKAKLSAAALYANEQIKPRAEGLTAFYARNRERCFVLQEEYHRAKSELHLKARLVEDSYKEEANGQDPFFTTYLPRMISIPLDVFEKRMSRCFERTAEDPGIGPIYDL